MHLAQIKLADIRPPKFLLRPVKKITIGYQEMLDSIQTYGLWQPLLVRPLYNTVYELVDGNYRYNCLRQLRHEDAPCIIRGLTDDEVLVAQLQANGIRPETSPVEFAERLAYLLKSTDGLTIPQLARMIHKSPDWIRKILQLTKLGPEIGLMVQRGEIPAESACALARLPDKVRALYVELALTLPCREFVKMARGELKKYREAARNTYIDNHKINQDKPIPYLRRIPEIKHEFNSPTAAGPTLLESEAKTPIDGWQACIAWVLHMDPKSLTVQENLIVKKHRQQERAIEKRRTERRLLKKARKRVGDKTLLIDESTFTPITEFGEPEDE